MENEYPGSQKLIKALQNPDLYDYPVKAFKILETHISWIILTGRFAYKIKKPVNFGFVDFSTLEKRQYYCEEELRLNRRFSSDIYLQTLAIRGSYSAPRLDGNHQIIEYAVKMREFSQKSLLSYIASEHQLNETHTDSVAQMIAVIHRLAARAETESRLGSPDSIQKWSKENFEQIEKAVSKAFLPDYFKALKDWCHDNFMQLQTTMSHRQRDGYVRECHGDLHLGNMVFLDNQCTAFDCIEFNEELRWIDTISEVAFVVMDLQARGYQNLSWRFLNHYLSICGDYEALALLPFYVVYRALVRAKVEALTVRYNKADSLHDNEYQRSRHFIDLAQSWSRQKNPRLILMHGLSGSGKSTVAEDLACRLGAIQIRSDIERKRLFNLDADSNSGSSIEQGIYDKDASRKTYHRLASIAESIASNGFNVIVDAACLKSSQRDLFRELALKLGIPFFLVSCHASEEELHKRIAQRLKLGRDASEANHQVLDNQLKTQQPLSDRESVNPNTILCDQSRLNNDQFNLILSGSIHH